MLLSVWGNQWFQPAGWGRGLRWFVCRTVSAGWWLACPLSLARHLVFLHPCSPTLVHLCLCLVVGLFVCLLLLCVCVKQRPYGSALCVLPASPTTFVSVARLQVCSVMEQLVHAAAAPPRGVPQPCLCKLSCQLFPNARVGLLLCVSS